MDRQAVLYREAPPQFTSIIDEFVLRREIGSPGVLRSQVAHLLNCATLPHLDLRVLPASVGAHASPSGGFLLFTTAEPDLEVGYAETVGGAVYVEPPDSEQFIRVYDRLLHSALGPAESVEFIRAIGEDLG
jgi:hypothetical protein